MSFTIYGKLNCPACMAAKNLLDGYKKSYTFVDTNLTENREILTARLPGAKVVPQIFNDDRYLGGLSELKQLLLSEGSPFSTDERQVLQEG